MSALESGTERRRHSYVSPEAPKPQVATFTPAFQVRGEDNTGLLPVTLIALCLWAGTQTCFSSTHTTIHVQLCALQECHSRLGKAEVCLAGTWGRQSKGIVHWGSPCPYIDVLGVPSRSYPAMYVPLLPSSVSC